MSRKHSLLKTVALSLTLAFGVAAQAAPSQSQSQRPPAALHDIRGTGDFVAVLNTDKPVLVEFYADWCGYCKMMKPLVAEAAAQRAGTMVIATVNVDAAGNGQLSRAFTNRGAVPAFVIFEHGKPVLRHDGAFASKASFNRFLNAAP